MDDNEIYENLCWYDPRNPYYVEQCPEDVITPRGNCGCDNCFYHRDKLALEIIKLSNTINRLG